jgi:hypothetical protein
MFDPIILLTKERLNATQKSYEYLNKIREGKYSKTKLKQLEKERDYWQNADITISRLIELFNKEKGQG